MILFPAIDLFEGKAVRLYQGDYAQMTVYNNDPLQVAQTFMEAGATHLHLVDLEGARSGDTPNLALISRLARLPLYIELGGGIRSLDVIERYLAAGISRVILGTAAATDPAFVKQAVDTFGGEHIAVGMDLKDGKVAVKGWTQVVEGDPLDFCRQMAAYGVGGMIATDISRDGAMRGANRALYAEIQSACDLKLVASGGVSSLEDIAALRDMGLYGAILGKAYYTGAVDLKTAIALAKGEGA